MNTIAAIEPQTQRSRLTRNNYIFSDHLDQVFEEITNCRWHLDEPLRSAFDHHFKKSGKMLRARLALRAGQASGLQLHSSVIWATSIELLHNASLVHDDVCDDDAERRGFTSVAEMYGKEVAICLGDAMIALSSLLLAGDFTLQHTLRAHNLAIIKLSTGQAAEFSSLSYPTWTIYEKLVEGKTTPLISLPVLGLNSIDESCTETSQVTHYLSEASVAFQMMNDIQNINQGKQTATAASDLRELRPNAVIANFYESLPELDKKLFSKSKADRKFQLHDTRLEFWWEQILLSNSIETTKHLLSEKLGRSKRILRSLNARNRDILQPFDQWLRESYSLLSSQ